MVGKVLDPGHDRPARAERVDARCVAITRDGGHGRFADRRTCGDGGNRHLVDVRAIQGQRVRCRGAGLHGDEAESLERIAQGEAPRAEIQHRMVDERRVRRDRGDVHDLGPEDLAIELDRARAAGETTTCGVIEVELCGVPAVVCHPVAGAVSSAASCVMCRC